MDEKKKSPLYPELNDDDVEENETRRELLAADEKVSQCNLSLELLNLSRRRQRQSWSKRGESFQWCSPSLQSLSEATYMELQLSSPM